MYATTPDSWWTVNQGVLETLMVPLAMVVRNELGHRSLEVPFAQQNHPVETLLLDRPHEPLRVCIRIRGMKWRLHDPNPRFVQPVAHGGAPLRISIADQHTTLLRVCHRERPDDLSHERFVSGYGVAPRIRTRRDARSITNTV